MHTLSMNRGSVVNNENEIELYVTPTATPGQLAIGREMIGHSQGDIQIDDGAIISDVEPDEDGLGGGFWIQAWVFVPTGVRE